MNNKYDWVPWFGALVKKIADGGEKYLIEQAKKVDWQKNDPPLLKFGDKNIDPFSFLYYLAQCNGYGTAKRKIVYESVDDAFDIGGKEFLSGAAFIDDGFIIPTPPFNASVLFHDGGEGNPGLLWKLFRQAVKGSDYIASEDFLKAIHIKRVGIPKLTECLFLINSKEFLPIDKVTFEFNTDLDLPDLRKARKEIIKKGWAECLSIFRKVKSNFPNSEFYEINTALYLMRKSGVKQITIDGKLFKAGSNMNNNGKNDASRSLNTIFYGPPGTGKTYHTISVAVEIIDPDFHEENKENRQQLRKRFEELKKEGLIEFVTFHQSFGYEEFVEGIRPVMDDEMDDQEKQDISYKIEDGVFKRICKKAKGVVLKGNDSSNLPEDTATVWKISLGSGGSIKKQCFDEGTIRIGWPAVGNFNAPDERGQQYLDNNPGAASILGQFRNISIGDLVAVLYNNKHIDAVGIVKGEYEYAPSANNGFPHSRKVEWIYRGEPLNIQGLNGGVPLTMRTCYWLDRINAKDLLELIEYGGEYEQETRPHALIIDEINRGNISRIFGELITLIEESKRLGGEEETTVTLPYSRESFGVPDNLYIIGTMNTADRSIALLDTALRRRFRFKEMMPDYKPLNGISVEGVNIGELLKAMNGRIEALFDRDHQIGHSYFLRLKDNANIKTLKDIFRYEIVPLLQEYFYDEWEKIDAVLNSNGFLKSNGPPKIINSKDFIDPDKKLWRINEDAFDEIEKYKTICGDGGNLKDDAEIDHAS